MIFIKASHGEHETLMHEGKCGTEPSFLHGFLLDDLKLFIDFEAIVKDLYLSCFPNASEATHYEDIPVLYLHRLRLVRETLCDRSLLEKFLFEVEHHKILSILLEHE